MRKASTSPMAGMYSGMKALSFVSNSVRTGVYLGLKKVIPLDGFEEFFELPADW